MEVSYRTILRKMEEHIATAKEQDSAAKMREHVQAIKALCEVILDSEQKQEIPSVIRPQPLATSISSGSLSLGEKKLEPEDGANGDSIFDF